MLEVVQDRLRLSAAEKTRVIEALESALKIGQGNAHCLAPPTQQDCAFPNEARR